MEAALLALCVWAAFELYNASLLRRTPPGEDLAKALGMRLSSLEKENIDLKERVRKLEDERNKDGRQGKAEGQSGEGAAA